MQVVFPKGRKEHMSTEQDWIVACNAKDIALEGVLRFDLDKNRTFAIYRTENDEYYATDGLCTHEKVHLADGFVVGTTIECPKHGGCFNFTTGQTLGAPVVKRLKTYPTKIENGKILFSIA